MLLKMSGQEMLDYWKTRFGMSGCDYVAPSSDLTGTDRMLETAIKVWYATLLASAPAEKLPVEDVAGECYWDYFDTRSTELRLPARAWRLVGVRMAEWKRMQTESEFAQAGSAAAKMQMYEQTRATWHQPLVVALPGRYELYGVSGSGAPERVEAVCAPADGSYVLCPTLLEQTQPIIYNT